MSPQSPSPRFVVHQHHATSRHFDFRLEVDGVLASWAVPKGPSTDPHDKRLAQRTDDHPMSYAGFEGVIPAGEYGAGPVIVWDEGTYRHLAHGRHEPQDPGEAVRAGHVTFRLAGHKLSGGYALTRIGTGPRERWLLVKMADDAADPARDLVRERPESVRSGRTIDQLRAGATAR